eukprot:6467302-Amphidinium_carterae.1
MGPKLRVRPAVKSLCRRPSARGGSRLLEPSPRREGERDRVEGHNPPHPAEVGEGIPGLAGLENNLFSQGGGHLGEPINVPEGDLGGVIPELPPLPNSQVPLGSCPQVGAGVYSRV